MVEKENKYRTKEEILSYKVQLERIVVAVDPAVTSTDQSAETGVVVAGRSFLGKGYVLEDLSMKGSPNQWAQEVMNAYRRWEADRIVAEVNQGGDLVESLMRSIDPRASYRAVRATRGKIMRAEPVAALYEQKKIFHVMPFSALEDQMCSYAPRDISMASDRLDALVWALTDLMLTEERKGILKARMVF